MRNVAIFIKLLFFVTACSSQLKEQVFSPPYYGKWKAVWKTSCFISALSTEEINAIKSREIFFSDKRAIVFGDSCASPTYNLSEQNTLDFLYLNKIPNNGLRIESDSLTLIKLGCLLPFKESDKDSPDFSYYVFYDKDGIYLLYQGEVFKLFRRDNAIR